MSDLDLPYPSSETKTARRALLGRRARAMRQRERRYDEHLDFGPAARKYSGVNRAGDWIEQASEAAACSVREVGS